MKEKEIILPYGYSLLKAKIPAENITYILRTQDVKGIDNEMETVISCLRAPIGCRALSDCVKKTDKVVVIVTDNTRPCPDDILLPPILKELRREGVKRDDITVISATGLHPPIPGRLKEIVGKEVLEEYDVLYHDAKKSEMVSFGETSWGVPIKVNKIVAEADFKISTGFIEPHFFAGFSGGRKSIAPGVFSVRSAYHNHGYQMIEHPKVRAGNLHGNPVHEDMIEQAQMAKLNFIVNVLLNKQGEITHVVAGHPFKAHEKGCQIESKIAGVKVPQRADITITTNSGAPLDIDLYQTCKGIDTAAQVTRDGGIIIVASLCNAGVGPEAFLELHRSVKSPKDVIRKIKREEPIGVQWENQILARTQLKQDVYIVSSLDRRTVRDMMMTPVRTVEEGLEKALSVLGDDTEIIVIPEGPLVLPTLAE